MARSENQGFGLGIVARNELRRSQIQSIEKYHESDENAKVSP